MVNIGWIFYSSYLTFYLRLVELHEQKAGQHLAWINEAIGLDDIFGIQTMN